MSCDYHSHSGIQVFPSDLSGVYCISTIESYLMQNLFDAYALIYDL